MLELGKVAALDYEKQQTNVDYSSSVGRQYSRTCVVSTGRPMLLMV